MLGRMPAKKWKFLAAAGAALLTLIALGVLMSGRPRAATTVIMSDDGALSLELAPGSLPEGISTDDIAIRREADRDIGEDIDVYSFTPSGISFMPAARLTITARASEPGHFILPLVAPLTDEGIGDLAVGYAMVVDENGATAKVSMDVPHFSEWAVMRDSHLHVAVDVEETQFLIGSAVDLPATVYLLETENAPPDPAQPGLQQFYLSNYTYEASGKTSVTAGAGVVTPSGEIGDKPPLQRLTGFKEKPPTFDLSDHTCAKKGDATITWTVDLLFYPQRNPNVPNRRLGSIVFPVHIRCVDAVDHSDTCNRNGVRDLPTEECDGNDFGTFSCQDAGFDFGSLICTDRCTVDKSECTNKPPTCADYEGGFLKTRNDCQAACDAANAQDTGIIRTGTCRCLPVDDAPGCFIACLGDACLEDGE